jgi:gluconate 2-dehydrogenase gamma chain
MMLLRRGFLRWAAIAIGNLSVLGRMGRLYAMARAGGNRGELAPGCVFFNVEQARTVEAVCDQIVPPDDCAGAREAGVLYFIDRALALWARQNRWDYVAGLEAIDESSRAMFKGNFADLPREQQIRVVEKIEQGIAPGRVWENFNIGPPVDAGYWAYLTDEAGNAQQKFFTLLIRHTMQGYYGHPKYGGNKQGASWKMLDYVGLRHL